MDAPLETGVVSFARLIQKKDFSGLLSKSSLDGKVGGLKRVLNLFDLFLLSIGTIFGAGAFVVVGTTARQLTGPGVVVSFAMAGVAILCSALCYSEMSAKIPHSGSAYSYAYASLGEVVAWITGWDLSLEYILAAASEARGATRHIAALCMLLGATWPEFLDNQKVGPFVLDPIAAVVIFLITLLLCLGTKGSVIFNSIMVFISVGILLFVVSMGIPLVHLENYNPFFPFGFAGVLHGGAVVLFGYLGFDCVTAVAEESKNPRKHLPTVLISTVVLSIILYAGISIVVTGMTRWNLLDLKTPLASAFSSHGFAWAKLIITIGGMASLLTTTYGALMPQARIWFSMARDGLLFPFFGRIHPRFNTPLNATVVSGVLAGLIALFINLEILAHLVSIGALFAFSVVCISLLAMRITVVSDAFPGEMQPQPISPETSRLFFGLIIAYVSLCAGASAAMMYIPTNYMGWTIGLASAALIPFVAIFFFKQQNVPTITFKCPMVPFVPLVAVALNIVFMFQLGGLSWLRFIVWLVIGMLFYLLYGLRHSKVTLGEEEWEAEIELDKRSDMSGLLEEREPLTRQRMTDGVVTTRIADAI